MSKALGYDINDSSWMYCCGLWHKIRHGRFQSLFQTHKTFLRYCQGKSSSQISELQRNVHGQPSHHVNQKGGNTRARKRTVWESVIRGRKHFQARNPAFLQIWRLFGCESRVCVSVVPVLAPGQLSTKKARDRSKTSICLSTC